VKRFGRGLVVGKFAPLHRGHELVIRAALECCEKVVLLSYSKPELPGCEAERRRRWLGALFPECQSLVVSDELLAARNSSERVPANDASDSDQRRFVGWVCRELLGTSVDAVFTSEAYGTGFARELGEYLGSAVEHVLVDADRVALPISATRIRADVHGQREWLSREVYASFVERVALLGGESSGKTELCAALAARFDTVWVAEYGRELWNERNGKLERADMRAIAEEQIRREEQALGEARRFVFCDTTPLTTLFYCQELFGEVDAELERLAARKYDALVLCAPDFSFVQDGTRRDAAFRQRQHEFYLRALGGRGLPFLLAEGSLSARVVALSERLGRL
jgi:HTH-type transcriptional regulator, transcriptional repressor of NAD biosynthesis genes